MLEKLFGSKLRAKLLGWFFTHADEKFFVRQLQSILQEDPANLSRELNRLAQIGVFSSEREGNLKYYFVNKECPFYQELKNLILKTVGVVGVLKKELRNIKGIKYAIIYGSIAKGTEEASSDVDLLIVGTPDLDELNEVISMTERQVGREINYVVFTPKEFSEKIDKKNGFIRDVLKNPKITLIGEHIEI